MLARSLAFIAVRRPGVLIAAAILLLFAALFLFQSRQSFDSEILNLLPETRRNVTASDGHIYMMAAYDGTPRDMLMNGTYNQEVNGAGQGRSDRDPQHAGRFL